MIKQWLAKLTQAKYNRQHGHGFEYAATELLLFGDSCVDRLEDEANLSTAHTWGESTAFEDGITLAIVYWNQRMADARRT